MRIVPLFGPVPAAALEGGGFDGEALVGIATGTPMEDHAGEFAAAFAPTGLELSDIIYCAESVLLPEYRGRGIGHRFFDIRVVKSVELDRRHIALCGVQRPADHPARSADYRPLDAFWRAPGYAPLPGVVATFLWKDLGETQETPKPLQFWIRKLT